MKIACFDMEGTLTPEIWEQVALDTGIEGLIKPLEIFQIMVS